MSKNDILADCLSPSPSLKRGQLRGLIFLQVLMDKSEPDDVDKLYLRALGELAEGGALAAGAMCDILLRNPDSVQRKLAASVLLTMRAGAVPVICARLQGARGPTRASLLTVLSTIGDPSAIPTLEVIAREGGDIGAAAQAALKVVRGPMPPMRNIRFSCPNCDGHLVANETSAGMQVRCAHCSATIKVPKTSAHVTKDIVVEDAVAPVSGQNLPALFKKFQAECVMQVVVVEQTQGRTLSEEDRFNSIMRCVHKKLNQATGRDIPVSEFTKLMNQSDSTK